MSMPAPAISPDAAVLPPHVMEPLHAELTLTYLGALVGMAGTMTDFLTEKGLVFEAADGQTQAALRRSLAEGPDLLAMLTGRAFATIVEEFVCDARSPAADGSCRAAALLTRIMQAVQ